MNRIAEPVRAAMEHPDGGVEVVTLESGDPLALFRELALESSRSGFVPALAGTDAPEVLPASLGHRHVVIVCEGDATRPVAINWVRQLARCSPRRHLVITFGSRIRVGGSRRAFRCGGTTRRRRGFAGASGESRALAPAGADAGSGALDGGGGRVGAPAR